MHLSNRYPITSKYYKLLFNGSLGYKKVAEFTVYPTLKLGSWVFEFNDDNSEESFQVYDHPKVFIFENVAHLSKEQLKTQFL
ncbi:MAG: tetratricopeptide TPR_2 repeat protein [uncultured bacterium]|nr:MAG: tetratricopeptide TPR_2 repeat protein [uncultured bacterium]